MDIPFHYIDLRTFCFETEAEDRVEDAFRTLLPADFPIERAVSEGHHGDEIIVLTARVENADEIRTVFDHILSLSELSRIVAELDERVDEKCSLFLQLDKQAAYTGSIRLGRGIMVRAKIEVYPAKREKAIATARAALTQE